MSRALPNPGSREARERGCVCPVIDNQHGRGYRFVEGREPEFVTIVGCPLHYPIVGGAR